MPQAPADDMPPYEQYAPEPTNFSAPDTGPASQPTGPAPFSASAPTPEPKPEPTAQPASAQEPQPQPAPNPAPAPEPQPASTPDQELDPAPEILTELPPELSNILATAFEVFGDDVRVSRS